MLYKYFKINEHSIANLMRNELYCQNFKAFNDPFECWFSLREGIPHPKREPERFRQICTAWGFPIEKMNADLEDYNLYMDELESYQPDIRAFLESVKISCFSKENDNLLMWSHYADGLRGFCVEFDEDLIVSNELDKEPSIVSVFYADKPPVVDKMLYSLAKDQIWYHEMAIQEEPHSTYVPDYKQALIDAEQLLNELYTKTVATKPIEWKYEEETRLVFSTNNNNEGEFFKYPAEAIKGIIFGEKINLKARETLIQIIETKKISIPMKIAERDIESYKIKFAPLN
jgi:hypothetical protein